MTRRRLSLWDAEPPSVALELASDRVSGAGLDLRGRQRVVTVHAIRGLPEGALVPALAAANIRDRAAVLVAVHQLLEAIGRPRRVGLVLPDVVAKVSIVRFEQVPHRTEELNELIRWQVRKTTPFPIDEAQVSHVPGVDGPDGHEFMVTVARRAVIEEYESMCADAGTHAGVVDISTLNVANAVMAGTDRPTDDWLLVNVTSDCASIAVLRGTHVIVFRSRSATADESLADLVHQTAMYYEDRLRGGGLTRVLLCGSSGVDEAHVGDVNEIRNSLESRLAMRVETVDPREAAMLTDRITASPMLLDTLAPLVGMLVREHGVTA